MYVKITSNAIKNQQSYEDMSLNKKLKCLNSNFIGYDKENNFRFLEFKLEN